MRCAKCGTTNSPTNSFCAKCGNALAKHCAKCQAENPPTSDFCGKCGASLSEPAEPLPAAPPELTREAAPSPAPAGERRHLCVLFCDLVGSTPLSQQLDAEDLRIVVGSYQRTCEAVVVRNGGFVAQYRGDSIEVYFGYPLAHEDDSSRVVRCALEIVEAVRQLAAATKVDLQVRIGIHSGHVVI